MPVKKPPFFLMFTSNKTNPKVAPLTDAQYRAWIYALGSARLQAPAGQWPSRVYLETDLGPEYAQHIDALIERDLIRESDDGVLMSANWDVNQSGITDPTNAERQRRYRENQRNALLTLRNTDTIRDDTTRLDKSRDDTKRNEQNATGESGDSPLTGVVAAKAAPSPSRTDEFEDLPF